MKRNNLLKRPLFLTTEIALAALLVACGGGGGDGLASVADGQSTSAAASDAASAAGTSGETAAVDTAAASADGGGAAAADASTGDEVASASNAAPEGDGVEVEGGGDIATRAQEADAAELAAAPAADATASAAGEQVASDAELDFRSPGDSVEESFAEAPPDTGETAAAAVEREEAQAVSGYATPRVAGLDYTKDFSSARKALLAKHKLILMTLPQSYGLTTLSRTVSDIKALNPSIKIGSYVINNETRCTATYGTDKYPIVSAVNKANWWLRTASGSKVQWTDQYGACDLNITSWSTRNSAGQTWIQWKWAYDWNTFFKPLTKLDYVFIDAFMWKPRKTADWNRDRVNDSPEQYDHPGGMRRGNANYVNAARATDSTLRVMGNADNDLSHTEYRELLDGAFLEGMIGRSWSTRDLGRMEQGDGALSCRAAQYPGYERCDLPDLCLTDRLQDGALWAGIGADGERLLHVHPVVGHDAAEVVRRVQRTVGYCGRCAAYRSGAERHLETSLFQWHRPGESEQVDDCKHQHRVRLQAVDWNAGPGGQQR